MGEAAAIPPPCVGVGVEVEVAPGGLVGVGVAVTSGGKVGEGVPVGVDVGVRLGVTVPVIVGVGEFSVSEKARLSQATGPPDDVPEL